MFGIKPGDTVPPTPDASQAAPQSTPIRDDVYVMPDQFHPEQGKKSSNKPLIIASIVLLLVIMATAAYFFYDMWQKNKQQPAIANTTPLTNQEIQTPEAPVEIATTTEMISTSTDPLNEESATTTATTTETNVPQPQISTTTPPQISSDSDNDGLTDAEESVIGSSPIKQDSDGDTYFDGVEVANGYSPLVAGNNKSKLDQAPFVTPLATNFAQDNYTTLIPQGWQPNLVPTMSQTVITTNTGEIIKISVKENPDKVSAANWYLTVNPKVVLSDLKSVTAGTLNGVLSPNNLEAYISDTSKGRVYVFEYIMEPSSPFRYPALFTMMIKQFKSVAGTVSPTASSTNP